MKKLLGILLFLCMICTLPVQPALAAYGYTSDAELENECGITFDPNGGEGSMEPLWHNGSFKLPECGFTAPEGCRFAGWRWNRELKQPGDAVYLGGVGVAVAVWEEIPADTTETTETPVETTEAPVETTEPTETTASTELTETTEPIAPTDPTEQSTDPAKTDEPKTDKPADTAPTVDGSKDGDSSILLFVGMGLGVLVAGVAVAIVLLLKKKLPGKS